MTKPILRALAGEAVWPPPLWLMRQAGRYLPEYRALRAEAGDFISLCINPRLAAEVTLQPVRRYGMDAAILFSDILMLPWALGYGLRFAEGEGPLLPPLRDAATLATLDPSRVPGAIAPILETVRRVRAELELTRPEQTALIGFAGAPFTVACYVVEGHGSKEFGAVRGMAYRDPALFDGLMDVLTEATIVYLAAQIEAGAEVVMLFDSWAGVLPPLLFAAHVIEPARRIVAALRERYPHVPVIGFPRLGGLSIAEYARTTGVQGLGLDTTVDPALASRLVPGPVALQGNLDPLAVEAGGPAMREAARKILAAMRGRPFVFNLGHGIVPSTPPQNVAELVGLVRAA
jgi:uroporphyrinogen decarboxylase